MLNRPYLTIVYSLLAVGAFVSQPAGGFYDRTTFAAGSWWQAWTGHWSHYSLSHLGWNLVVFIPSAAWFERNHPLRARLLLISLPPVASVSAYFLEPQMTTYGGLSGLAMGMLVGLALTELRTGSKSSWFWGSIVGLVVLKIGLELLGDGRSVFSEYDRETIKVSWSVHVVSLGMGLTSGWIRSGNQDR